MSKTFDEATRTRDVATGTVGGESTVHSSDRSTSLTVQEIESNPVAKETLREAYVKHLAKVPVRTAALADAVSSRLDSPKTPYHWIAKFERNDLLIRTKKPESKFSLCQLTPKGVEYAKRILGHMNREAFIESIVEAFDDYKRQNMERTGVNKEEKSKILRDAYEGWPK